LYHRRSTTGILARVLGFGISRAPEEAGREDMLLLLIVLILLIGVLPTWPYSSGWGYYPSGGLGTILLILLILVLLGRI
jgi:hypothetical protein